MVPIVEAPPESVTLIPTAKKGAVSKLTFERFSIRRVPVLSMFSAPPVLPDTISYWSTLSWASVTEVAVFMSVACTVVPALPPITRLSYLLNFSADSAETDIDVTALPANATFNFPIFAP